MPEVTTTVRLPADLHETIKTAATENVRSFNGEIIARLKASVKK
jgi:hypothetical protein